MKFRDYYMTEEQAIKDSFSLPTLRKAIAPKYFHPIFWKSLSYFLRDFLLIGLLASAALYFDSWFFWPVYWFLQGTMLWAIFCIGHDCGHLSFARTPWVNHFFGCIVHTCVLVPYFSFRISHLNHHMNTSHVHKDEGWIPITEAQYKAAPFFAKFIRYDLFFLLFIWYLFLRDKTKSGSHFLPSSPLFKPEHKWEVLFSSFLCLSFVAAIGGLSLLYGWGTMAKLYWVPYLVFVAYYGMITLMQHTSPEIPWYRDKGWSFFKGSLSTMDRDLGVIDYLTHDSGTHVIHHLFTHIPHYYLKEATKEITPLLGEHYHHRSGSFFKDFWKVYRHCRYVPEEGDTVYYIDTD